MEQKLKPSLFFIGFLQALGLILYCGLVAILFWRGDRMFGQTPNVFAPLLLLIVFCTSALISGLLTLGYPFILFWEKKQTGKALRLVAYTAFWLVTTSLLLISLVIFKNNF